jgi:hypothetical protein
VVVVCPGFKKFRLRTSTGESQGKQALGSAKSSKCAVGRDIRGDRLGSDADAGPVVSPAGMDGAAGKHHRGKSGVSSAVDHEFDFSAQNLAIFAHSCAMARTRRVALGGSGHVFHAIVNKFHRPSTLDGEQCGVGGDHGWIFFFSAESPAGLHLYDPDFVSGQATQRHQRFVNIIRTLQ